MTVVTEAEATPRCTGLKKHGTPCSRIAVTETRLGLRCAWHDPDRPQDAARRRRGPRPPVDALRTAQDVTTLASWAAIMSARGRLTHGQATDVLHACREFRQAFRDSGILEQFEALKATVARLTAAKDGRPQ